VIPAAIAAGWKPEFTYQDRLHKRTTIDHIPADPVSFSKQDPDLKIPKYHAGQIYHPEHQWRVWIRKHGNYEVYRDFPSMEAILNAKLA
jgi:hypothetical protein